MTLTFHCRPCDTDRTVGPYAAKPCASALLVQCPACLTVRRITSTVEVVGAVRVARLRAFVELGRHDDDIARLPEVVR